MRIAPGAVTSLRKQTKCVVQLSDNEGKRLNFGLMPEVVGMERASIPGRV